MNRKSNRPPTGAAGKDRAFSSAFKKYDKETPLTEQSTYGPYDTHSFNAKGDTASLSDIFGVERRSNGVSGLISSKTPVSTTIKPKRKPSEKGLSRKERRALEFQTPADGEAKAPKVSTVSKDGVLSFVNSNEQDEFGNMKAIDAGFAMPIKKKKSKSGGFQSMDLHPDVFNGVMKMGFKVPTPIQRKSIPLLLEGNDVVAMARTGSGKTAAFAIPLLHKLSTSAQTQGNFAIGANVLQQRTKGVRAVVLSPTRELAQQTFKVISQLGRFLNLKTIMLVGGQSLSVQFELLSQNPDVIVATPGRLVHHLVEVQFSLMDVEFCCFDEADRLFEMGFAQQLYEILKRMNEDRQTCLFSATMPTALIEFSRAGLKNPIPIRLDSESKLSPDLSVSFFTVRSRDKIAALLYTLAHLVPEDQQAMVFTATKYHVEFLAQVLNLANIPAACVYGDLDSEARQINLAKFRNKHVRVLLVTDVAARGLDIPLLDNVINYDFPAKPKLFIHRAGRVARAGHTGTAYSFVTPDEMPYLLDLYLFFAWHMPLLDHLDIKSAAAETEKELKEAAAAASITMQANSDQQEMQDSLQEIDGLVIEETETVEQEQQDDDDDDVANQDIAARVVDLGRFPTALIDSENDYVRSLIVSHDLERVEYSVSLAFTKYLKNRPSASVAATRRWKEASLPGIHPAVLRAQAELGMTSEANIMGLGDDSNDLVSLDNALTALSNFTPSQTIFELMHSDSAGTMKMKRREHDALIRRRLHKGDKGDAPVEEADDAEVVAPVVAMGSGLSALLAARQRAGKTVVTTDSKTKMSAAERRKRKKLEEKLRTGEISSVAEIDAIIADGRAEAKRQKTEQASNTQYISLKPQSAISEVEGMSINNIRGMQDMALDITGEDESGIRKAKKIEKWDDRKKKFITSYEKKDVFGRNIINEAGQRVRSDKPSGSLYEDWQRKHKKGAAIGDHDVEGKSMRNVAKLSNMKQKGSHGSSEIKSADEIRKERQSNEINKIRHAKKDRNGGKGGKDKGGKGRESRK